MTLIELLWYIVLLFVVVGGPVTFMVTSLTQQNQVASRTIAARQAEAGLEQMVRDLRQAMPQDASGAALHVTVSNPTSSITSVTFSIPTVGASTTPQSVTWTCPSSGSATYGNCSRTVGAGSARPLISGAKVTFSPVSSSGSSMTLPATDPAYLGMTLSVQVTSQSDTTQSNAARGVTHPITIQSGADLRNFA